MTIVLMLERKKGLVTSKRKNDVTNEVSPYDSHVKYACDCAY